MNDQLNKVLSKYFDPDGDLLLIEPGYTLADYYDEGKSNAVDLILDEYIEVFYDTEHYGQYAFVGVALVMVMYGRNRQKIRLKAIAILEEDINSGCQSSIFSYEQATELLEILINYKEHSLGLKIARVNKPKIFHHNFPYDKGDTFLLLLDHESLIDLPFYKKWVSFSVVKTYIRDDRTNFVVMFYNWYNDTPQFVEDISNLWFMSMYNINRRFLGLDVHFWEPRVDLFDGKTCIHIGKYDIDKQMEKMLKTSRGMEFNMDFVAASNDYVKRFLRLIYTNLHKTSDFCVDGCFVKEKEIEESSSIS